MKVEGPGRSQGTDKSKKKGGVGFGGGNFGDFLTSGSSQSAPAAQTHSIAQLDALLALQGAEDPAKGASRKRMRQRALNILGKLDDLRMAMLNGTMTVGHMIDVADVVASHRENVSDPSLTAIMDEIDLRAQVELAKMRVALDKRGDKGGSR
jgi:hypothetical protein